MAGKRANFDELQAAFYESVRQRDALRRDVAERDETIADRDATIELHRRGYEQLGFDPARDEPGPWLTRTSARLAKPDAPDVEERLRQLALDRLIATDPGGTEVFRFEATPEYKLLQDAQYLIADHLEQAGVTS